MLDYCAMSLVGVGPFLCSDIDTQTKSLESSQNFIVIEINISLQVTDIS